MSLRFLATGDLQIHKWKQFSYIREDGQNSRLHNCLRVFDILKKEAALRGITKVLLNGDIFEDNAFIDVEVFDSTYRKLEELYKENLDVILNVGNHDICGEFGGRVIHSLRSFRRIATVVEKPKLLWELLQVVPWMSNPESIKKAVFRLSGGSGLVLHCGVQGAVTGPKGYLTRNPIKLEDIRLKDFKLVLLSDYHTPQFLAKNVFYMGSPIAHNFGETHKPCVWDISLSRDGYTAKKIYTGFPEFIRVKAKKLFDLEAVEDKLKGNYVSVVLQSDKISESEVEAFAKGKFLVRFDHEKEDKTIEPVQVISADEALSRYVKSNAKEASQDRLLSLGERIFRGEL